jgi:hypothetical protein
MEGSGRQLVDQSKRDNSPISTGKEHAIELAQPRR